MNKKLLAHKVTSYPNVYQSVKQAIKLVDMVYNVHVSPVRVCKIKKMAHCNIQPTSLLQRGCANMELIWLLMGRKQYFALALIEWIRIEHIAIKVKNEIDRHIFPIRLQKWSSLEKGRPSWK